MSAPFDLLTDALPALRERLDRLRALHDPAALWPLLERLLLAHAPSGGANLPGAIGDEIGALAGSLGLGERFLPQIGATGNAALALGADKDQADVVVAAHMDRPSFRVRSVEHGTLYPICADRFPAGEYRVAAKALRFEDGRLTVGARGEIISIKGGDQPALRFEAEQGALAWQDTVVMDPPPTFRDGTVTGTGLDNSLGVLTALLAAAALASLEDALRQQDRRCLIVFTDQEEGPPEGFFGHGAARLTHALPSPTCGAVIVDAHTAGPGLEPQPGVGASHSTASNWGRGSIVPPHYHALALDLAAGVNNARPGTVQMNTGYLSRSDDMILGRWARILALTGPPMTDPHTGHESARLSDVQAGAWWLACFLAAALDLVPALRERYALGR
ncbi:MAG: hypothetical protein GXY36_04170 [Chloroflexi bacterium]|nr:hypothetical protein [Chloroflexota bacterium]